MKEFFETYIQHQEDIEYFLQESLKNSGNLLNHKKNDFKQLDFKSMLPNIDDKKSVSNKVNKFFSDISKDKNVVVPLTSANNDTDKIELIKKYKKLLDEEIITKEEFEQQKKKLLDL